MKKKRCFKTILACSALALIFSVSSINVLAEDITSVPTALSDSEEYATVNFDSIFGADNSALSVKTLGDNLIEVDPDAFGQLKWELPSSSENIGYLNLEYTLLSDKMDSYGYGTDYQLSNTQKLSGYSGSIRDHFNSTFGNTSSTLTSYSMPEGWTVSSIMQNANEQRTEILGDYKSSEAYQSIANSISTSNIFSTARQTMTLPSNSSLQSLASKLSSVSSGNDYYSSMNAGYASYQGKISDVPSPESITYKYYDYTKKADNWLSNKTTTFDDLTTKVNNDFQNNELGSTIAGEFYNKVKEEQPNGTRSGFSDEAAKTISDWLFTHENSSNEKVGGDGGNF
ncbi:MAG: hypothetical protein IJ341_02015 [Bacteroidales bacterium]|nr:hypothetical protein [Bacteroidales bacterium]